MSGQELPKKYKHQESEEKWAKHWEELGVYRWDKSRPREETFVVDTPPPTVSGSLHVGHVFSYTHTDAIVRYQRMRGKNTFYPMGWDDNGLPTERRVQNVFGIRCDPTLPHNTEWKPTKLDPKDQKKSKDKKGEMVSRLNFIEACDLLTAEDEKAFEAMWRRLGLSVDWGLQYATIDKHCIEVSQLSFLDLIEKGHAYASSAPTMWDVDFETAVAQAELEDRDVGGKFHDISFGIEGGGEFVISTTRPELLPACIAVVAHPDDERYKPLFGKKAITPLFHAPVPIMAAEHADPEKGSGILMVCTFGDIMDVEWWKQSRMPAKQVLGRDGCLAPVTFGEAPFESVNPEAANENYKKLEGAYAVKARKLIAELLAEDGSRIGGEGAALVGEPKQIMHPVKFFEKGDRPLEFIPTRQWFVKVLDFKEELVAQGKKIDWHPEFMRTRYEHWVEGLNFDWCISRQRFFGVPFPVWYPLDEQGEPNYDKPIYATAESLPVDPLSQPAPGYTEEQRGKPGGFAGDPDVMDTWATSALTPQIASGWGVDEERHKGLFPMDLRPQGHDIIRTWAFVTITKAWMHENNIPWKNVAVSGWILDPDRKKMSKSKGNVVTPGALLDEYSSDAVRYWACRARLGTDTAFDEKVFRIGQKLVTKLFNAGKFVVMQLENFPKSEDNLSQVTEPLDKLFLDEMRSVIASATEAFDKFDYAHALQQAEDQFWRFCDHYLELVKARSYAEGDSPEKRSALATLEYCLGAFLRMFAPSIPYITEEVWSWRFGAADSSIHKAPWPSVEELSAVEVFESAQSLPVAIDVLTQVRKLKTTEQKSQRWPVASIVIEASSERLEALKPLLPDLLPSMSVLEGAEELREGEPAEGQLTSVTATLADKKDE